MTRFVTTLRVTVLLFAIGPPMFAVAQAEEPPAQIAVSPSKFEVEIGSKPSVESLRVFNLGSKPVTVTVSVATWDLDENSKVRIVEPTEQSLDQWLIINPLEFTIEEGQSQAVRFSIRPRVQPEPGEHRAMIYLTQQSEDDSSSPVTVRFRLGVAIYGYSGEIQRTAVLHGISVDDDTQRVSAEFDIASDGDAHVRLRGQYSVWPASSYPGPERTEEIPDLELPKTSIPDPIVEAGFLPTTPVLAGTRRTIVLHTSKKLPPGDYVLDINGKLSNLTIDRGLPFTVVPASPTPAVEGPQPASGE
jgi:hypothetical protein